MIPPSPTLAQDMMTRDVGVVRADMDLEDVVEYLVLKGISNAPVVGGDGRRFLGFISERDCLEHMVDTMYYDAPSRTAASIMRRHPVCVGPDTELFALASIFIEHGYRHLPVVSDGDLVGIVSRRDVLRMLSAYQRQVRGLLTSSKEPREELDPREVVNRHFLLE